MKRVLFCFAQLILLISTSYCLFFSISLFLFKVIVYAESNLWIVYHIDFFESVIPVKIRKAFHFYDQPTFWFLLGSLQLLIFAKTVSVKKKDNFTEQQKNLSSETIS